MSKLVEWVCMTSVILQPVSRYDEIVWDGDGYWWVPGYENGRNYGKFTFLEFWAD